jgi:hypothetical protein
VEECPNISHTAQNADNAERVLGAWRAACLQKHDLKIQWRKLFAL